MTMTSIVADPIRGIKVDAAIVAEPFRQEIRDRVKKLNAQGFEAPLLVGLLANTDPAAKQYAEWTARACRADGLRYDLRMVDDPIHVEDALLAANADPSVHGIIVYYPIFGMTESFSGASQDDYLRDTVAYQCDVEGLCHLYRTNLYRNVRYINNDLHQKCLLPCTALSVVKILEACPGVYDKTRPVKQQLAGKCITIINRSEIVGRPVAAMLANDGATVYSIDINSIYKLEAGKVHTVDAATETVESCVRKSSIVVTGVPTKSYRLPTEWIQPQTVVVNVASYKNVDEEALLQIPGVVYVPQVGKVTVAMLERNVIRLYDQFHHPRERTWWTSWAESVRTVGTPIQLYTAMAVTVLLALQFGTKKR